MVKFRGEWVDAPWVNLNLNSATGGPKGSDGGGEAHRTEDQASEAYPSLKVIVIALGQRAGYRPNLYSKDELFCGPDCQGGRDSEGKPRLVQTPVGSYDASVIKRVPGWDQPDLVVVKADATGRNFPGNLSSFRCPKVLVVGNTQHFEAPIRRLLNYAEQERFDFVTSDHKRHHLHFFAEAGFSKICWMPGLNVYPHRQPWRDERIPQILFVVQTGRFHPYRNQVLDGLKKAGLPLTIVAAPQKSAAALYAGSLIDLNCSLNGDLNLRVFEVMSSGGFLLTDRLAPEAGLELLFKEGLDYEAWGNEGELIEKARYFLDHPQDALAIAQRGQDAFWLRHAPVTKANEFIDWITKGTLRAEYEIALDTRTKSVPVSNVATVVGRAAIYERAQELQLLRRHGRVLVQSGVDWTVILDLLDLPRVTVTVGGTKAEMAPEALAALERAGTRDRVQWSSDARAGHPADPWDLLVLADARDETELRDQVLDQPAFEVAFSRGLDAGESAAVITLFASLGFAAKGGTTRSFACERPGLLGQALLACGVEYKARLLLKAAVERLSEEPDGLTDASVLAIKLGQEEIGELCLRSAVALRPTHERARKMLALLYRHTAREKESARLEEYLDLFPRGVSVEPEGALLSPKRILVVNNLFPPQELGGYGRLLADFSHLLRARRHEVHVLSSDTSYLGDKPGQEPGVERSLRLFGGWEGGRTRTGEASEIRECTAHNQRVMKTVLDTYRPQLCLLGNIDFLGPSIIDMLLAAKIPVLHHLGNASPGYIPADSPKDARYRLAAASVWLARKVLGAGYSFPQVDVIYPGAVVQEFDSNELPNRDILRIAYASIVLPYKGAHVLVAALAELHRRGVPFSCTIAGTSTDQKFVDGLKSTVANVGMEAKVAFVGFLDRPRLKQLFSTHNVLAFPSQFEEPFGISQVEAMAAGMVVVSSGTGGASEVVEDEVSGLLVPAGSSAALAAALAGLREDDERWQVLAQAGRERARKVFDIRRSVDQIEETFARLLAEHGRGG